MRPFEFHVLPAPLALQEDVECIRIAEYRGTDAFSVKIAPNCRPGLVFQHHQGRSPIESIARPSHIRDSAPLVYLYGQITEPSVMHHFPGPYTMTQIVFKPHALYTLLGLNAPVLTDGAAELQEFAPAGASPRGISAGDLQDQLLDATSQPERIALLTRFLLAQRQAAPARDPLVEQSLRLIHRNLGAIQVRALREQLNISERHFERRFRQVVGVSPQFNLRVQRFNEAVRLLKARHLPKMTDVAHALNFHDEAHFSRDVKALAGLTPKRLAHYEDDYRQGQAGYFYV